jgi:hypothetical protein
MPGYDQPNLYNSNPGIYGSFGGFPPMYGSIPGAPVTMPGNDAFPRHHALVRAHRGREFFGFYYSTV